VSFGSSLAHLVAGGRGSRGHGRFGWTAGL